MSHLGVGKRTLTHIQKCTHTSIVWIHSYTQVHTTLLRMRTHAWMQAHTQMNVNTHRHTHINIRARIHTYGKHTQTHTHTHTHTCSYPPPLILACTSTFAALLENVGKKRVGNKKRVGGRGQRWGQGQSSLMARNQGKLPPCK